MKSFDAPASREQVEEYIAIKIAKFVHQEVTMSDEEDVEVINTNAANHTKAWILDILSSRGSTMDLLTGGEFDLASFEQGL
jgi:hypothetical protein